MKRYTPDTSTNNYVVPEYSDAVDGPGAFKAFADGLDTQHIVPIKEGILSNTNLIGDNTNEINAISNRLDALENTTLSAEWTIRVDGGVPNAGEVSLNSDVWASVTALNFSLNDKNGVTHDFSNVKEGDTIQIGVGPEAKAAGSSAAYTVEEVGENGEFTVRHLSSTGSPVAGFTAIVAVYPQFDPSGYATTAELNAVEADKLSKGDGLKASTAKVLEDAIETNADSLTTEINTRQEADEKVLEDAKDYTDEKILAIKPSDDKFDRGTGDLDYADAVVLGQAVTTNKGDIADNATSIENLAKGLNVEINADGSVNIIGGGEVPDLDKLEADISKKFDIGTGTTNLNDATTMEAAIDKNASNITNISNSLGGTVDGDGNITIDKIDALPPQDGKDGQFLKTNGSIADWAEIDIPDALPDGGSEGQFLSVDADGDAIWASPKTGDIALSADDVNPFYDIGEETLANQSEVNTYIAETAYFRGQTITWGELANKTA